MSGEKYLLLIREFKLLEIKLDTLIMQSKKDGYLDQFIATMTGAMILTCQDCERHIKNVVGECEHG